MIESHLTYGTFHLSIKFLPQTAAAVAAHSIALLEHFFFLLMCFVPFTCISTALFYLAVVASLQTFYFVLVKQSAKSNENDSFASHINYYHFFFIWL